MLGKPGEDGEQGFREACVGQGSPWKSGVWQEWQRVEGLAGAGLVGAWELGGSVVWDPRHPADRATSVWILTGPSWGCRGKKGEPDIHPGQFWFQDVAAGGRGGAGEGLALGLGQWSSWQPRAGEDSSLLGQVSSLPLQVLASISCKKEVKRSEDP